MTSRSGKEMDSQVEPSRSKKKSSSNSKKTSRKKRSDNNQKKQDAGSTPTFEISAPFSFRKLSSSDGWWACPDCTFQNIPSAFVCEMCERPNPDTPASQPPSSAEPPTRHNSIAASTTITSTSTTAAATSPLQQPTQQSSATPPRVPPNASATTTFKNAWPVAEEEDSAWWWCSRCTFQNLPLLNVCEICGNPKSADSLVLVQSDELNIRPTSGGTSSSTSFSFGLGASPKGLGVAVVGHDATPSSFSTLGGSRDDPEANDWCLEEDEPQDFSSSSSSSNNCSQHASDDEEETENQIHKSRTTAQQPEGTAAGAPLHPMLYKTKRSQSIPCLDFSPSQRIANATTSIGNISDGDSGDPKGQERKQPGIRGAGTAILPTPSPTSAFLHGSPSSRSGALPPLQPVEASVAPKVRRRRTRSVDWAAWEDHVTGSDDEDTSSDSDDASQDCSDDEDAENNSDGEYSSEEEIVERNKMEPSNEIDDFDTLSAAYGTSEHTAQDMIEAYHVPYLKEEEETEKAIAAKTRGKAEELGAPEAGYYEYDGAVEETIEGYAEPDVRENSSQGKSNPSIAEKTNEKACRDYGYEPDELYEAYEAYDCKEKGKGKDMEKNGKGKGKEEKEKDEDKEKEKEKEKEDENLNDAEVAAECDGPYLELQTNGQLVAADPKSNPPLKRSLAMSQTIPFKSQTPQQQPAPQKLPLASDCSKQRKREHNINTKKKTKESHSRASAFSNTPEQKDELQYLAQILRQFRELNPVFLSFLENLKQHLEAYLDERGERPLSLDERQQMKELTDAVRNARATMKTLETSIERRDKHEWLKNPSAAWSVDLLHFATLYTCTENAVKNNSNLIRTVHAHLSTLPLLVNITSSPSASLQVKATMTAASSLPSDEAWDSSNPPPMSSTTTTITTTERATTLTVSGTPSKARQLSLSSPATRTAMARQSSKSSGLTLINQHGTTLCAASYEHLALSDLIKARRKIKTELRRFRKHNEVLRKLVTQKSDLLVLQQSARALTSITRSLLDQLQQLRARELSTNRKQQRPLHPEATVEEEVKESTWADHLTFVREAVRGVERRLNVTEDRGAERDWNKEFQDILDSMSLLANEPEFGHARAEQADKLCTLAKEFVAAAKMYGKIIISEVFLPYKEKTIKPSSVGGVAGGEKYVHRNILFKFATDSGIYGDDEFAMKVASHELKGLTRYFSCAIRRLHFPLMALIDFRGYRLVASSILPISGSTTLRYGSNNAGSRFPTVHTDDPILNELMKKAGQKMNLEGHHVFTGHKLYAPMDIEGHLGFDSRYYIIDFSRTFPPTNPEEAKERHPRGFLYRLFRPEFVLKYPHPLNSDAFSMFGRVGRTNPGNPAAREASNYLFKVTIPRFAAWLEMYIDTLGGDDHLSVNLHRDGINNRYLGLVRSHCTCLTVRDMLMREMVARTIKNILRADMRNKMSNISSLLRHRDSALGDAEPTTTNGQVESQGKIFSSQSRPKLFPHATHSNNYQARSEERTFNTMIAEVFNAVIGNTPQSDSYWELQIRPKLLRSFSGVEADANIRPAKEHMHILFKRIQQLAGIQLSDQVLKELQTEDGPNSVVFAYPDIIKLTSRVRHMNIVEESEALAVGLKALESQNKQLSLRLLWYARNHYEKAVSTSTDNAKTLLRLGEVLKELAKREDSAGGTSERRLDIGYASITRFTAAAELEFKDHAISFHCGNVACELGEYLEHPPFFAKAKDSFVEAFKRYHHNTATASSEQSAVGRESVATTSSPPAPLPYKSVIQSNVPGHLYIKQVAEKALVFMEKVDTTLSTIYCEAALQLLQAVLEVHPNNFHLLFLCAELCYAWAKQLRDSTSEPYKNAIKYYQMVIKFAHGPPLEEGSCSLPDSHSTSGISIQCKSVLNYQKEYQKQDQLSQKQLEMTSPAITPEKPQYPKSQRRSSQVEPSPLDTIQHLGHASLSLSSELLLLELSDSSSPPFSPRSLNSSLSSSSSSPSLSSSLKKSSKEAQGDKEAKTKREKKSPRPPSASPSSACSSFSSSKDDKKQNQRESDGQKKTHKKQRRSFLVTGEGVGQQRSPTEGTTPLDPPKKRPKERDKEKEIKKKDKHKDKKTKYKGQKEDLELDVPPIDGLSEHQTTTTADANLTMMLDWPCSVCTFVNDFSAFACEMCEASRPSPLPRSNQSDPQPSPSSSSSTKRQPQSSANNNNNNKKEEETAVGIKLMVQGDTAASSSPILENTTTSTRATVTLSGKLTVPRRSPRPASVDCSGDGGSGSGEEGRKEQQQATSNSDPHLPVQASKKKSTVSKLFGSSASFSLKKKKKEEKEAKKTLKEQQKAAGKQRLLDERKSPRKGSKESGTDSGHRKSSKEEPNRKESKKKDEKALSSSSPLSSPAPASNNRSSSPSPSSQRRLSDSNTHDTNNDNNHNTNNNGPLNRRKNLRAWRWIDQLHSLRLAFYLDLASSFPQSSMFWIKRGNVIWEHLESLTPDHFLQGNVDPMSEKRNLIVAAAKHYSQALTLNPEYMRALEKDNDQHYLSSNGEFKANVAKPKIEAAYTIMRNFIKMAHSNPELQSKMGNACALLGMQRLYLVPFAKHLTDPILQALVTGGGTKESPSNRGLSLTSLSLSCCHHISGECLDQLSLCISTSLTELRLKGLSGISTQKFRSFISKCTKLTHLSLPNFSSSTWEPLVAISQYCTSLQSLAFGTMGDLWKDEFLQVARSCTNLTELDFYYCNNVTGDIVDEFLSNCRQLLRLRLPCLLPAVLQQVAFNASSARSIATLKGGRTLEDSRLRSWASKHNDVLHRLQVFDMDGYSHLHASSLLSLFNAFGSIATLSLENTRELDNESLKTLAVNAGSSLRHLNISHCIKIGDESLGVVATNCYRLRSLNVSLTQIGGDSLEMIARNCKQLVDFSLGCPYRVRDNHLKTLIYNHFPKLKRLTFFRAAKAEFRYSISEAKTLQKAVLFSDNTLLPSYAAKACPYAMNEQIDRALRRLRSNTALAQVEGLKMLAYDFFTPYEAPQTRDNRRYFAQKGGIEDLIALMGPANGDQVRIQATKAVWNLTASEKLARLLLGEGVLAPLIRSLQSVIPQLQQAGTGALWNYLEFDDVAEKAVELGAVDALLRLLDITAEKHRWRVIACFVCLAQNVACRRSMVTEGVGRAILSRQYINIYSGSTTHPDENNVVDFAPEPPSDEESEDYWSSDDEDEEEQRSNNNNNNNNKRKKNSKNADVNIRSNVSLKISDELDPSRVVSSGRRLSKIEVNESDSPTDADYQLMTQYMSALTLGYLLLDSRNDSDLLETTVAGNALDQIQYFLNVQRVQDVARWQQEHGEKQQQEGGSLQWKFMRPFMDLTFSRHPSVQQLGYFSMAAFAHQTNLAKKMIAEGMRGMLVCKLWQTEAQRSRAMLGYILKAIHRRIGYYANETGEWVVPPPPPLELMCVAAISGDENLCGLLGLVSLFGGAANLHHHQLQQQSQQQAQQTQPSSSSFSSLQLQKSNNGERGEGQWAKRQRQKKTLQKLLEITHKHANVHTLLGSRLEL